MTETTKMVKALEIATEIVVAECQGNNESLGKTNGTQLGEHFAALYEKVLEITKSIPE